MEPLLAKFKGIHPGLILERELGKRKLRKGPFARSLSLYPQILNDITKGRRGFTPALSLKVDKALGLEEGTMLLLQTYYEIKKEKEKSNTTDHPDLSILRGALFWDTDINKVDWQKQYRAIIERIFQRGNTEERKEIINFYGEEKVRSVIGEQDINSNIPIMPHLKQNKCFTGTR
jgi:plasmid maintenance system antidote protein VapI